VNIGGLLGILLPFRKLFLEELKFFRLVPILIKKSAKRQITLL